MNRRSILTGAAAITASALCPPLQADSPQHAIRVAAGRDRFNEHAALGPNRSIDCKVSGKDTHGIWSSFESHWQGKGGPPLHVHHDQDEWFYVMEGSYIFQIGGEKFTLTSGDSVLAPRQIPHTFAHLREERGRILSAFQPAGTMEAFFHEQSKLTGTPSPEEIQRMYKSHGLELLGPSLAL
jgi:mannose-6-phosphate isomerase-like protein (cupin superfamily)